MIRGFYSGSQGALTYQYGLDVIANNVSNVQTIGFKPQRPSFSALLYQHFITPDGTEPQNLKVGTGVRMTESAIIFRQGTLDTTDRPLDAAIVGEGFFQIEDEEGNLYYTRDGAFQLSMSEGGYFLRTGTGHYVLNDAGERIFVENADNIALLAPGQASPIPDEDADGNMRELQEISLGIYQFINKYGLNLMGDNVYAETENSGEAMMMLNPELRQGVIERSGVDLGDEMVKLIAAQRAFSFSTKVIQTADEIEQITNSLR